MKPLNKKVLVVPNDSFKVARETSPDSSVFCRQLTGIVLGKKYEEITTRIPALKANVRGSLAYYGTAVEYGEPIAMTYEMICDIFRRKYQPNRRKMDTFRHVILPNLEDVGILKSESGKIEANLDVYETFYDLAHEKIPVVQRTQMEIADAVRP